MQTYKALIWIFCISLFVTGCSYFDSPGKPVTDNNTQRMEELKQGVATSYNRLDTIDITNEKYLGGGIKVTQSKVLDLPAFFKKKVVVIRNQAYDFDSAIAEIQTHIPCDIDVTPNHKPANNDKISLQYQGTVKGLLDKITSYYNLYWEFDNSSVSIAYLKTANYKIYSNVGKVASSVEMNNSSTSNAGGSSGVSQSTSEGKGIQSASIVSDVDIWKDIEDDLKKLISEDGSVTANQVAGFVTVSDTPWIHKAVKTYVANLNNELSRQAAIVVKVFNLEIDDSSDHGFDANAVFTSLKEDYTLSLKTIGDSVASASSALSSGVLSGAVLESATGKLGQFQGSAFMLEALKSHGKVSLVTTASGISLNNQDMPIQNVTNTGYVAESSVTTSGDTSTNSITPGNITTGFSMIVTPHILDNNKILLQYSVSFSSSPVLKEFTSGDSTIQTPDYSSRSFTQRVALESGNTLLLAGFETQSNTDENTTKLWGLEKKGESTRSMIVISITVNRVEGARS